MGRDKLPENKKKKAIPCNCHLSMEDIELIGGDKEVRRIFKNAGIKAIESFIIVKRKSHEAILHQHP